MDGVQFAFPRPGRAVKALLVVLGVVALVEGILVHWVPSGAGIIRRLELIPDQFTSQPWSLLTTFFITNPDSYAHVAFSLLGLYFLGTAMEATWGGARLLRFVGLTAVLGYAVGLGIALVSTTGSFLAPPAMYGPDAAITALALAFGREFPNREIRLFFVIPVTGRIIVWLTVGFALLGVVLASSTYEGAATRVAAVGFAFLLAGTPSPLRALYLKAKLRSLQRQSDSVTAPRAKKRVGGPSLRVVRGGLDDDERPPKDQLN